MLSKIGDILESIRKSIQSYFDGLEGAEQTEEFIIRLENISMLDSGGGGGLDEIQEGVLMSMVNVEEEKSLRYHEVYSQIPNASNGSQDELAIHHSPTVPLNLYVLFVCHRKNHHKALNDLSRIVHFFQRKNVFVQEGSSLASYANNVQALSAIPSSVEQLNFELYSLSFEQSNHLWGILGGKYLPSVLYKVRLVKHKNLDRLSGRGRIMRERGKSLSK